MNFTTTEGMLIGLAIIVVAICFWVIIKTIKNKRQSEESSEVEDSSEESEKKDEGEDEFVIEFDDDSEEETPQPQPEEESEPIYCSCCGKDTNGKVKRIKNDPEKHELCKRCYRSFMKGKMPQPVEGQDDN